MKKVSELEGAELDYWVAKAEGIPADYRQMFDSEDYECKAKPKGKQVWQVYAPSCRWDHGGPIIEREDISLTRAAFPDPEQGHQPWAADINDTNKHYGDTPLIAAMRCFVASKFGEEIKAE